MAVTFQHNDLAIEIFDDTAFIPTVDSPTSYSKVIQTDKEYSPTSKHAIKIYRENRLINSAVILAAGGATGVSDDTALVDEDNLIIRCCNKLFSLTLPDLNINWVTEPDQITCFSIHKYQDTYISHGELTIARIDRTGKIIWSFGGVDIFVCLYQGNPFEMSNTYIALTDFNGNTYKIDYDGNLLDYEKSDHYQQESIIILQKFKKKWWKFW